MHLRDLLRAQLSSLDQIFGHDADLAVLETGSIRSTDPQYELDDGWSTVTFAEWARDRAHALFMTIDLDMNAADDVLATRGLHIDDADRRSMVLMFENNSITILGELLEKGAHPIHLAYLDSDNDPALILNEYLLVRLMMPSGAILMVDDCDPETGGHKGDAIIPVLKKNDIPFELVRRHGVGYATNVLVARMP